MAKTTAKESIIAPPRRRLSDLYVVGKPLVFDEDSDEPIEVWLSKLSPVQQRDAANNATGARARLLALKNNPESDPQQIAVFREQLEDLGVRDRESMIEFMIVPKVQETRAAAAERIASEGKWGENDYLTSLQEAWNGGLDEKYAADENDEEAKAVYDALFEYTQEVEEAVEEEKENLCLEYEHLSDADLDRQVIERAIDAEADFAWVNEFSRWQIYYAVRLPEDHKSLYFIDREEVDELDAQVTERILQEYNQMTVEPSEGKG